MIKISASILAADFTKLGDEIKLIEKLKIPYIHIDVMDGHFVPNISMGIPIVESLRKMTNSVFDVHLMLTNPQEYIERFAAAGADIINFHLEAVDNPLDVINQIKKTGKKTAITISPDTPAESVFKFLHYVDMVLIMSVYPGFGGQKFLLKSFDKITKIYNYIKENNLNVDIEVDGGVRLDNISEILRAGVNVVVMGSALFKAKNVFEEVERLNEIFKEFDNK